MGESGEGMVFTVGYSREPVWFIDGDWKRKVYGLNWSHKTYIIMGA